MGSFGSHRRDRGRRPGSRAPAASAQESHAGRTAATSSGRKVEVLHVTAMRSTKYGGVERYFVELARRCGVARLSSRAAVLRSASERPVRARPRRCRRARRGADPRLAGLYRRSRPLADRPTPPRHRASALLRRLDAPRCWLVCPLARSEACGRHGPPHAFCRLGPVARAGSRELYADGPHLVRLRLGQAGPGGARRAPADSPRSTSACPSSALSRSQVRAEVRAELAIAPAAPVLVSTLFNSKMKAIDVLVDAFADHLAADFPSSTSSSSVCRTPIAGALPRAPTAAPGACTGPASPTTCGPSWPLPTCTCNRREERPSAWRSSRRCGNRCPSWPRGSGAFPKS